MSCQCERRFATNFDEVYFTIRADDRSGSYTDWDIRERTVETPIPGTNRVYVERLGFDPATVTWTIEFCCADEYYELLSRYGYTGTLTVMEGRQSLKGDAVARERYGNLYEALENTRLVAISNAPHFIDGSVEVDVTFKRTVDPVTRLAVIV